ncbi:MAG: DUF1016 family protein [Lentisphaerae bacterium]|jgi:ERCC4-type nuclease|nr:DUF1016 family protein [Lentisphaerota bacterium]MBT4814607.1 DUF1016 family protein [Lentisphaerota bacterium]MBT5610126.1 DUF1016 family protein [Lentisphaerota bacterium]MBT7053582.1 DUF1016 family protein [Lentisphaerota bacterium]MBT7842114.1 DUF1016 family protein [Lentisphaerota bacterium]
MAFDPSVLMISATKPDGKPARELEASGVRIMPVLEDEGNVDRYVLSKRLGVERRTGSRFLAGIMDKTLFTGAIYLREHFEIPILIVEGEINYEYSMFDPQAVRGALTSMLIKYGLTVLSTRDVGETVALLSMMARQEQVGIPEISLIPKRKAVDLPDLQRRVIEMLPGCGMVMARELLKQFGTVRRIANASAEELLAVRGIGQRTADGMEEVLGADYRAVDTERDIEDAIEADPSLLFHEEVQFVARQHCIYTDAQDRHVVDMVFRDCTADALVLVELKRGKLTRGHAEQLRRYLDTADQSRLLRGELTGGRMVRGILATVEPSRFASPYADIEPRVIEREKVIDVLQGLRRESLR